MDGLTKFREAFAEYSDNYVIIGGTACSIVMERTSVRPRATHDIDMIVVVEKMTPEFGARFWNFVKEAGYRPERRRQDENDSPKYEMYRFLDGKVGYPEMIELLSRRSDVFAVPEGVNIEPIPVGDDVSSLSAIIMDDDYYNFTVQHSVLTDGIRHADPAALVALKTRAYLNLLADKKDGKHVNTRDIKKHRSDVLKNIVIMLDESVTAPSAVVACVHEFSASIRSEWSELGDALARSLEQTPGFVEALLIQMDNLFIVE